MSYDVTPADAPANTKKDERTIGEMMPKADWAIARDKVSSPGKRDGKIYLARPDNEYAGKIVLMTDTHLVQQVGRTSAITHDLTRLANANDIVRQWSDDKISTRTNIVVRYGQEKGDVEVVPFNLQRANEVKAQAAVWAEKSIANDKTRGVFMKHIAAFTDEMAKGIKLQAAKAPAAPLRQHDRSLQQERTH